MLIETRKVLQEIDLSLDIQIADDLRAELVIPPPASEGIIRQPKGLATREELLKKRAALTRQLALVNYRLDNYDDIFSENLPVSPPKD